MTVGSNVGVLSAFVFAFGATTVYEYLKINTDYAKTATEKQTKFKLC